MEEVVRNEGATPATIALIDGCVQVGLNGKQLDRIASPDSQAVKASTRDIPNVLAKASCCSSLIRITFENFRSLLEAQRSLQRCGPHTRRASECSQLAESVAYIAVQSKVRACSIVHSLIKLLAAFDISADLIELGRIPVAVVCAGAKSILDIPKTLEFLVSLLKS